MSPFDLRDVCMVIGSLATLDLPMVVDLIGIFVLKGLYCTLTMTNWFLQAVSVIPRGSWGDFSRRFTMIRWASPKMCRGPDLENDNRQPLKYQFPREIGRSQTPRRHKAQENYNNLTTQLREIFDYINRGGNDKKVEESSSRRPQPPPDDQNRPSGGSASRGRGSGGSSRRDDRRDSSKKRRSSSGGGGSGTGGDLMDLTRRMLNGGSLTSELTIREQLFRLEATVEDLLFSKDSELSIDF
ncbi:hypothetical protein F511_42909 [Dorcoceras hygrometricum]|uniref:Uncharacterized protein n=1 Tax=Dorcoceras hygrometricum TaxID=472368 RepID=A0A2Z7BB98_9LAMI|nr:hypothetical protein F511_42909 [Dorcoceras hygrometricum]